MKQVTYYSFRIEGEFLSETEKFIQAFQRPDTQKDLNNILAVIQEMGNRKGASAHYFRHERAAEALPAPYVSGDLRLYCIRVSDSVVILGNGCEKDAQKAQNSRNCKSYFGFMNVLSAEITRRLAERELKIIGKSLKGDLHFELGDCYDQDF